MIQSLTPNLMVKDVAGSIRFYCDKLGFTLEKALDDKGGVHAELTPGMEALWAKVTHGPVTVMFQSADSLRAEMPSITQSEPTATATFYFQLEDIDTFYEACSLKVDILHPLEDKWYGMREFYLQDNSGYILAFGQILKTD